MLCQYDCGKYQKHWTKQNTHQAEPVMEMVLTGNLVTDG